MDERPASFVRTRGRENGHLKDRCYIKKDTVIMLFLLLFEHASVEILLSVIRCDVHGGWMSLQQHKPNFV